ncbi:unnamed protein product [Larinioides sclopetarius]|uniref:Uncharacterized protein n=1 Tax=Larinioides sclopetarius TaxID=280406 RepID=A0AAV2BZ61_9ARAC
MCRVASLYANRPGQRHSGHFCNNSFQSTSVCIASCWICKIWLFLSCRHVSTARSSKDYPLPPTSSFCRETLMNGRNSRFLVRRTPLLSAPVDSNI